MKRLAVLLLAASLLAGCSDDGGSSGSSGSDPASAFTAQAPEGYRDLAADRGTLHPAWGDDLQGNNGGFLVLGQPDGDATEVTVLELTGFEGYQGAINQGSDAYATGAWDEREVDGRPALVSTSNGVTEVLAERGDDIAVAARSAQLDVGELTDLILDTDIPSGVRPTGAPDVDPPEGFDVLGRATADLALAFTGYADEGFAGGPTSAEVRAWEGRGGDDVLVAMTLPADAGDVEALLGFPLTTHQGDAVEAERFEIDGRDASWLRMESYGYVLTTTEWGDLLLLITRTSGVDAELLGREQLTAVAESVEHV